MGGSRRLLGACAASLVLTGCWSQIGFGPEHRRHNPFEQGITAANVDTLAPAWSVDVPGDISEPVVANGRVHFSWTGQPGSYNVEGLDVATAGDVLAYVRLGANFRDRDLVVRDRATLATLWTAAIPDPPGVSSIAIADGHVYVQALTPGAPNFPLVAGDVVYVAVGEDLHVLGTGGAPLATFAGTGVPRSLAGGRLYTTTSEAGVTTVHSLALTG